MNILFKCDKSDFIGLGHYIRCSTLAETFKKKKIKYFFLGLKPGIKKKNTISKTDQKKDLEYTRKFIKKKNIKIVIKDIYCLDKYWEEKIAEKTFLTVIDDFNNKDHYCDIYINYHYNFFKKKHFRYLKKKNCKKLIGSNYTIIKSLNFKKKINFKEKTIFIYMGGADKKMLMLKISKLFLNNKFNKFKKIFLLNDNHKKNKDLIKNLSKIKNKKIIKNKIKNLNQYFVSSDLCITPAGNTMIEQIALKSNNLILTQNYNQISIANSLYKKGYINLITDISKLNFNYIRRLIGKKIIKQKLVNPLGKNLIAKEIIENFNLSK